MQAQHIKSTCGIYSIYISSPNDANLSSVPSLSGPFCMYGPYACHSCYIYIFGNCRERFNENRCSSSCQTNSPDKLDAFPTRIRCHTWAFPVDFTLALFLFYLGDDIRQVELEDMGRLYIYWTHTNLCAWSAYLCQ